MANYKVYYVRHLKPGEAGLGNLVAVFCSTLDVVKDTTFTDLVPEQYRQEPGFYTLMESCEQTLTVAKKKNDNGASGT